MGYVKFKVNGEELGPLTGFEGGYVSQTRPGIFEVNNFIFTFEFNPGLLAGSSAFQWIFTRAARAGKRDCSLDVVGNTGNEGVLRYFKQCSVRRLSFSTLDQNSTNKLLLTVEIVPEEIETHFPKGFRIQSFAGYDSSGALRFRTLSSMFKVEGLSLSLGKVIRVEGLSGLNLDLNPEYPILDFWISGDDDFGVQNVLNVYQGTLHGESRTFDADIKILDYSGANAFNIRLRAFSIVHLEIPNEKALNTVLLRVKPKYIEWMQNI